MAAPSPRQQQQQTPLDLDRFRDQLVRMRADFQMLIQQQPLPRQDLENMRVQLLQMAGSLADHVRRFPNHEPDKARIARRDLEGLVADIDHMLYGRTMPQQPPGQQNPQGQQQQPQGNPPQRQQTPRLPVPRRAPAPQRILTYDVSIGPLPHQRFQLTLPPGETLRNLYQAAVARGQVVEREHQAGALRLDGNTVTPRSINGQIPPAEASAVGQNPTEREMLSLLLRHECFSLPPTRSPAGGDYTAGGAGHIPGFDVVQVQPMTGVQFPTRSQRMDQFKDDYVAQLATGAPIRVAQASQPQAPFTRPGTRKRRGG